MSKKYTWWNASPKPPIWSPFDNIISKPIFKEWEKGFPIIPKQAWKLGQQLWKVLEDQENKKNEVLQAAKKLADDYWYFGTINQNWYKIALHKDKIIIKSEIEKLSVIAFFDKWIISWSKFDWKIFLEKDAVNFAEKVLDRSNL